MVGLSVKGVVFILALATTMLCGCLALLLPGFLLIPFSIRGYRWYIDWLFDTWLSFAVSLIELVFGVKVRVRGDLKPLSAGHPTLIIMNHRTRFDWLFLWCYMLRLGTLRHLKIILKKSLKSVPGLGWAMQVVHCIFLHRKWAQDELYIRRTLRFFADHRYPLQLLLFPEGTDLSPTNREKDRDYAEKNGLEVYQHVLHPRSLGFVSCVQEMSWKGPVAVCDITVGYLGGIAQNESDLLAGIWPSEIHFHVKHIPPGQLPTGGEQKELAEWLKSRWDEKEQLLSGFSETKSFPGPELKEGRHVQLRMVAGLLFWIGYLVTFFYCLVGVSYFWLLTLAVAALYLCVDQVFGGWDSVELWIHEHSRHRAIQ